MDDDAIHSELCDIRAVLGRLEDHAVTTHARTAVAATHAIIDMLIQGFERAAGLEEPRPEPLHPLH